ncbi:SMC-Scp complex subunit ScpB [Fervidobacterium nodosum]|uniref:Putative transcriptional regulator n=1 Tax=Fervidobacterium nodosum (strain ATCC 35602 / DSM 5306 / Rt17-B1) TaxID=381764 RepID=A7HN23_FERNB|nr:SMC-Scp complex subunit ScpB [Fervidobacterium nodosum]ABS61306.1 putative transcriptional regulator [Fervidobacterium nodosum Rt17-B1]
MSQYNTKTKKALIESIIFASRGISKENISTLTEIPLEEIELLINEIKEDYSSENHGIELREIEGYLRFYTKPQFSSIVSKVAKRRYLGSLSSSQLEIAIFLAVRKQATKLEIDSMRGKDSTNIIKQLLASGVIKRRKSGRTFIYSLTETFKDESMIEELVRQAGGASFESIAQNIFEPEEQINTNNKQENKEN